MTRYGDVSNFLSGADPERMKVLVPLDGSPRAETAFNYLSALTPVGSLDVHLLAVIDDTEDDNPERLTNQRNLLEAYLRDKAQGLREGIANSETMVVQGSPAVAILAEADRIDSKLIVISSHSRSGVQRWRLGSVADKIVRSAACDTLVIGDDAQEQVPTIRSLLLPLDGSDLAEQAIPQATRLAEKLGAELHAVRVVPPTALPASDMTGLGSTSPELFESITSAADEYIQSAKARAGAVTATMLLGTPAESLIEYIKENAIDLVVMTSHGRGGLLRSALGSVTDRLLGGGAPVLVVRGK